MAESVVTFRGTSAAVLLVLMAARANGVVINRTKLAKLLYLADLRAVDEDLPPGSDVEWRWRHYGPYSDALLAVERDLEAAGVMEVSQTLNYYGGREIRLRLRAADPLVAIDPRFATIVDQIMQEHGRLSASQLKDLTYQTPPMQAAQRVGQRELRLDLSGGEPYPDLHGALARLRRIAATSPLPGDEPGALDDLATEIDEWSNLRREATGRIIGE
jgi:uncharacterized phage-associated protein